MPGWGAHISVDLSGFLSRLHHLIRSVQEGNGLSSGTGIARPEFTAAIAIYYAVFRTPADGCSIIGSVRHIREILLLRGLRGTAPAPDKSSCRSADSEEGGDAGQQLFPVDISVFYFCRNHIFLLMALKSLSACQPIFVIFFTLIESVPPCRGLKFIGMNRTFL